MAPSTNATNMDSIKLPHLAGTPKQIAWAETIRDAYIQEFTEKIIKEFGDDQEVVDFLAVVISKTSTDSKFWIDHRPAKGTSDPVKDLEGQFRRFFRPSEQWEKSRRSISIPKQDKYSAEDVKQSFISVSKGDEGERDWKDEYTHLIPALIGAGISTRCTSDDINKLNENKTIKTIERLHGSRANRIALRSLAAAEELEKLGR